MTGDPFRVCYEAPKSKALASLPHFYSYLQQLFYNFHIYFIVFQYYHHHRSKNHVILAVHHHAAPTANVGDVVIATFAHALMTTLVIHMKVAVPNVSEILSVPRIVLAYAINAPILAQALAA